MKEKNSPIIFAVVFPFSLLALSFLLSFLLSREYSSSNTFVDTFSEYGREAIEACIPRQKLSRLFFMCAKGRIYEIQQRFATMKYSAATQFYKKLLAISGMCVPRMNVNGKTLSTD
jgi:hypothetical protein